MDPRPGTEPLERALDALLDAPARGARALVDAVLAVGAAASCEAWALGPAGWRPVLARGTPALLPARPTVRAVLDGDLPSELPLGRAVVRAGGAALALGGATGEDGVDLAHALLRVHAAAAGEAASIDLAEPPLPGSESPDRGAPPGPDDPLHFGRDI